MINYDYCIVLVIHLDLFESIIVLAFALIVNGIDNAIARYIGFSVFIY